jgi:AcrR family transcriptional regulator
MRSVSPAGSSAVENLRRTPTQDRAHQTIEILLDSTAQVLVEVGYARLSTNRVAKRAGVSVGTLYQYFADKDALVEALAQRIGERQLLVLTEQLAQSAGAPLEDTVRGLILGVVEAKRVEPELSQALACEVPRRGQLDHERRTLQRLTELVSAALRRRTDVRPMNAEIAAFTLVHSTFAVIQAALGDRPELLTDNELSESLVDLCLRYLRPG